METPFWTVQQIRATSLCGRPSLSAVSSDSSAAKSGATLIAMELESGATAASEESESPPRSQASQASAALQADYARLIRNQSLQSQLGLTKSGIDLLEQMVVGDKESARAAQQVLESLLLDKVIMISAHRKLMKPSQICRQKMKAMSRKGCTNSRKMVGLLAEKGHVRIMIRPLRIDGIVATSRRRRRRLSGTRLCQPSTIFGIAKLPATRLPIQAALLCIVPLPRSEHVPLAGALIPPCALPAQNP